MNPFLPSWIFQQQYKEREAARKRMLATPSEPWTPDIKWKPVLHIQVESYRWFVRDLFPEATEVLPGEDFARHKCMVLSPSGRFCYAKKILPPNGMLATLSGRKHGHVFFDAPVMIPMLFERKQSGERFYDFPEEPWMSLTPMELFSLRPGTKLTKGHTVIAGLGLGHQLIEVSHRPTVRAITLVEKNPELVSWLLPRIRTHMDPRVPLRVIVGSAYDIVPQLTADVALIDIFPRYGGNRETWRYKTRGCPAIGRVWVWGG